MKKTAFTNKLKQIIKEEKQRLNENIIVPTDIDLFLNSVCKLKTFKLVNYGQEGCINLLLVRPTVLSKEQMICISMYEKFCSATLMDTGLVLSFLA